jgi:hypothetical protein
MARKSYKKKGTTSHAKIGGAAWNAGRQQIVRKGKSAKARQFKRKTYRGLKGA